MTAYTKFEILIAKYFMKMFKICHYDFQFLIINKKILNFFNKSQSLILKGDSGSLNNLFISDQNFM